MDRGGGASLRGLDVRDGLSTLATNRCTSGHRTVAGDFSVTYKVGGLLNDLARLLETHSQLRAAVLDKLHGAGIEVVSPAVETSRAFPADHAFIPPSNTATITDEVSVADEIMFDQAAAAAVSHDKREALRAEYETALARRDAAKTLVERRRLAAEVERLAKALDGLDG